MGHVWDTGFIDGVQSLMRKNRRADTQDSAVNEPRLDTITFTKSPPKHDMYRTDNSLRFSKRAPLV